VIGAGAVTRNVNRRTTLAIAIVLLGAPGSVGATTYNCLPVELVDQPDHVRVHCAEPSNFEGGYPKDGADRIEYFAVPNADADFAKRFVHIVETALTAGMVVQFQYTSGALVAGCDAKLCRKPYAVGLLAPGTDVRIPYAVWPSGASESIAKGAWRHYGPFSISTFRKLVVTMTGTGNADLYVRRDDPPTDAQFTCRPSLSTSAETVSISGPAPAVRAATYYVAVKGVGASNTYKLGVAIQNKTAGAAPGGC
jgi:hypothetical protein